MPLSLPARFGPYEVQAPLGAGGMGEVYRALDTRLGREVALKVLPADFAQDPDRLRRFELEARSASALSHPAIVTVHDVGREGELSYIVMELVEGQDLRRLLRGGPLPPRKALALAAQVADGLAAAHAKGIVHRDLKPENIMVNSTGQAKILDFGIAKTAAPHRAPHEATEPLNAVSTEPGMVLGTAGYLSPEQAKGLDVGPASDQFAFGAVLYEMLSGERAFHRDSTVETLAAIIKEEPPRLTRFNISQPLVWVVERCLAKDPHDRYAATRDLALELALLKDRLASGENADITAALSVQPATPKRRVWVLPLAAAGLLLAGAGLTWLLRPATPASQPRQRFITFSGQDSAPAFSPDGKTLAFSSNRTGVPRIWIKQYPKGEEAVLSEGPDSNPRFTPDGTQILFNRITDGGRSDLYRISAVGGDSRLLVPNAIGGEISPDGRHLAFLRNRTDPKGIIGTAVLVALPDGGEPRELGWSSGALRGKPRWSQDGKSIAVSSQPEGSYLTQPWRIELFSPAGGPPRVLNPPQSSGALSSITWTADGKLLYTQSDGLYGSNAGDIVLQDPRSGVAHQLLHSLAVGPELDLSPEGDVVLEAWMPRSNLRLTEGATGDGQWLTLGICTDRQPAAAPDGKRIAFSSNRDGNLDLWELRLDSGRLRRLTDDAAADWDPCYSADGRHLYWSSNRTGNYEIWTARADGTEARAVTNLGWDVENPTPSPDGTSLIFGAYDTPHFGVWRMDAKGGSPRQLFAGTVGAPPEPSPDGRTLAVCVSGAEELSILLLDGATGAEKGRIPLGKRAGLTRSVITGRSRWTPDGRALILVSADEKDRLGIFRYPVDAKGVSSRQLMLSMQPGLDPESFAVLPDGQRMVIALQERATNLLRVTGLPLRPRRRN